MRSLHILGLFVVISFGIVTILGSAKTQDPQKVNEFQRTIPKCFSDKECERKWAAAQAWVVTHAAYKIQIATDSLIETYNATNSSTGIAVQVVKEPIGGTGYRFLIRVWCDNMFGCRPDTWDASIDFNRTINAVVTAQ